MRFPSSSNFSLKSSCIIYRKDYFALERRLRSESKMKKIKEKDAESTGELKMLDSEAED